MPSKPERPAVSRRALRLAGLCAAIVLIGVVVAGITTRKRADAHLRDMTEAQAVPYVAVVAPDTRGRRTTMELPGRLEAYSQAQIFARVSGYIKDWKADIGTAVKAGQVLAEIDAPDLDQQIMQAEADVTTARANLDLAQQTLDRGKTLISSGAVSQQTLDQRAADAASRRGLLRSSEANLDRLRVLDRYKQIVAPFDGIVTARATDVGALINAGAGGGPALFVVSDIAKLRAYVNVPQSYVPEILVGTKATITVPEYPDRRFLATVEASARSVDIASGTTRMLLVVDNPKGELMTGAFANVSFELAHPQVSTVIPASALLFDQSGLRVATVGPGDKVVLKKVTISRDLGKEIDIGSGLASDDRVIASPPDGLANGDAVKISKDTREATETDAPPPGKPKS